MCGCENAVMHNFWMMMVWFFLDHGHQHQACWCLPGYTLLRRGKIFCAGVSRADWKSFKLHLKDLTDKNRFAHGKLWDGMPKSEGECDPRFIACKQRACHGLSADWQLSWPQWTWSSQKFFILEVILPSKLQPWIWKEQTSGCLGN